MRQRIIRITASAMAASCLSAIGFYNFGGIALAHQAFIVCGSVLIIGLLIKGE